MVERFLTVKKDVIIPGCGLWSNKFSIYSCSAKFLLNFSLSCCIFSLLSLCCFVLSGVDDAASACGATMNSASTTEVKSSWSPGAAVSIGFVE